MLCLSGFELYSLGAPVILRTAAIDKRSSVAIAWALKACQYWAHVLRPNPQNFSVSENSARLRGLRGLRGNFGRGPTDLQNVNPFSLTGIPTELVRCSTLDIIQAQESGHLRFESSQETNLCTFKIHRHPLDHSIRDPSQLNLGQNPSWVTFFLFAPFIAMGRISSVGRALDCRAGDRVFDSRRGRTNTHGFKW